MRFLSIYKTAERGVPPSPEEMAKMGKLIEDEMKAGTLLATEGCLPTALGARVRISGGKLTVTDGPFTEAKEVVGGFALLKANSKEEAIELVKNFLHVAGHVDDGEIAERLAEGVLRRRDAFANGVHDHGGGMSRSAGGRQIGANRGSLRLDRDDAGRVSSSHRTAHDGRVNQNPGRGGRRGRGWKGGGGAGARGGR